MVFYYLSHNRIVKAQCAIYSEALPIASQSIEVEEGLIQMSDIKPH